MAQDGAFGLVANTDTKLLIYHLFQKVRILALDGLRQRYAHGTRACLLEAVCSVTLDLRSEGISAISRMCTLQISGWSLARKTRIGRYALAVLLSIKSTGLQDSSTW